MTSKSLLPADGPVELTEGKKTETPGGGRTKNRISAIPFSEYWRHSLWPEGLTFLMYFLYHVVTVAVALATCVRNTGPASDAMKAVAKSLFGAFNPVLFVTFIAACVLAFHGYSYLTDRRALDFYESQPFSRRGHFYGVFLHGLSVFLIAYVLTKAAALLIAAGMGVFSVAILKATLLDALCNICLFLAAYGICVLAVMLTGNMLVSVLAGCVLLLYEVTLRLFIDLLARGYFKTFADAFSDWSFTRAWSFPFTFWGSVRGFCLHDILLAAAAMTAAYLFYRIRRNEDAGRSVLFGPVRMIVKIAIAILPALFIGYLLADASGVIAANLCAALLALITGCVMEIIYAKDFKALLSHWPVTLAAALLGVGILSIFFMDPFGYDRYVPAPSEVTSCAVICDNYYTDYYEAGDTVTHTDSVQYQAKNMHIEDAEAVTKLAEQLRGRTSGRTTVTVLYRLAGGRQVARQYFLPEEPDPVLLDPVIGNQEFKEGFFQIYNEPLMERIAKEGMVLVGYECNSAEPVRVEMPFKELAEAYKKDLEKFDYSYLSEHVVIGMITVSDLNGYGADGQVGVLFGEIRLPVFAGFDNTASFLKNANLYAGPYAASDLTKLTLSYYVSADKDTDAAASEAVDVDVQALRKAGGDYADNMITFEITDPAVLEQIFPEGVTERRYDMQLLESSRGILWHVDCNVELPGEYISCDVRAKDLPEEILAEFAKYVGK